jgi:tRNA threonylcarbamoyladenosine biosynthesis protein TsaE
MIINSLDQLNNISLKIIEKVSKEDCILLFGEIGSGKTTLTRLLINNLQKKNNLDFTEVLSPTFNIVYEYGIKSYKIMHYDFYRLKNEKDIKQLGVFNQDIDCIKIIEWAEIIKEKPLNRLEVYMSHREEKNSRILDLKGFGKWKNFNGI